MNEKKESRYHKYLTDLVKIDDDFLKKIEERKLKLKDDKEKKRQHKEDLKYQPIHKCLIEIMNDVELLEAVKKYGKTIIFAQGGGSHREYTGYDHLEMKLDSDTSEVKFYLIKLQDTAVGDLEYHRVPFGFKLYVKDNKIKYNYWGSEDDAARAICHDIFYTQDSQGIKKHTAQSIHRSLEKAIRNIINYKSED